MTEADKRTQARIPADVHQWLTDRAKTNDRSMNAELVRILKEVKDGTIEKTAYERGRMEGIQQAMNP
jgi:hypothetical protein